jgi:hypothetical protein
MALTLWSKRQPEPPRLPRAANIVSNHDGTPSSEVLPPQAPAHFEYAEEAKHAAQRYLELVVHIEQLKTERDDWRGRALATENEVARLLKREAALLAQIDSQTSAVLKRVEEYETALTVISAQYGSAGKLFLNGFAMLDEAGLRLNIDLPGLAALAAALRR